ncbi:MAG: PqqD family protein [Methylocystis sp.]
MERVVLDEERNSMSLGPSTLVQQAKEQLSCPLNEEVAILNLKSTLYYSLEGVGPFIWQQLSEEKTVKEIVVAVVKRFDVDELQCEADVIAFLNELGAAGLIQTSDS